MAEPASKQNPNGSTVTNTAETASKEQVYILRLSYKHGQKMYSGLKVEKQHHKVHL